MISGGTSQLKTSQGTNPAPGAEQDISSGKFQCPPAVTMCVAKILVSQVAGICESDISSITSFVALIKDAGVA